APQYPPTRAAARSWTATSTSSSRPATCPPRRPPCRPMPAHRYPDWESFKFPAAAADGPVAFCPALSPASVLGAYRRGVIPLPAPDEYFRTLNEVRYEDEVAAGASAIIGGDPGEPHWAAG